MKKGQNVSANSESASSAEVGCAEVVQGSNAFTIKPYIKKHKWKVSLFAMVMLLNALVNVPLAIIPAYIIVAISEANFTQALLCVLYFWIALAVGSICYALVAILRGKITAEVGAEMSADVASQAFKISSSAYASHQTGNFLRRIQNDPEVIMNRFLKILTNLSYLISYTVICVYILTVNIWTSLLILAYFVAFMIYSQKEKKNRTKWEQKVNVSKEENESLLNEVVRSERDIKTLNLEGSLSKTVGQSFGRYKKTLLGRTKSYTKYDIVDSIMWDLFFVGIMALGIVLMDIGCLVFATFLIIFNNKASFNILADHYLEVVDSLAEIKLARDRINELYVNEEYGLETFGKINCPNISNNIEFKNVAFSYIEYRDFTEEEMLEKAKYNKKHKIKERIPTREVVGSKKVFDDLSFKVEENTTVAFVGKSGCGKSTILNLIAKVFPADSGKVLIGGYDVNDLDKETLRTSISLVNQFPYVFDMSIRENLLLAKPDATDEELQQVINDAMLDELVAGLPNGIDTRVGESGVKLSGGQKQRLAIARALLKDSKIIILDESTSSLDNFAQNKIMESVDRIKGKSTIIIVAHRLSTIKNVDKIFFMDKGEIVDVGTFEELKEHNDTFRKLYDVENL